MVHTSPTWGYTIRWDASEWTVAEELSHAEGDLLALQDTLGNTILFAGGEGFSGDAEACLDDLLASARAAPDTSDFVVLETTMGAPYEWRDAA